MKTWAAAIVAALILVIIWIVIGVQWSDCAKLGNEFVRGVIWFRCIRP